MILNNFDDVERELAAYLPAVRLMTGKDITLERMRPLMAHIGNPEQQLHIIHIAGTSGKTSTAYFIAELLMTTGKSIGLTVSPHIQSINERVQINNEPLPETLFCQELSTFMDLIKDLASPPTYYELLVAFAFWYFVRAGVDYAVVETGLGGLFDSTNIAKRSDKVCVITDIGIDHTHILGRTLEEIAAQKAGIIHDQNRTFMLVQAPEIMDVFRAACEQKHATLHVLQSEQIKENVLPLFQQRNWTLAQAVARYVAKRDKLELHEITTPHAVAGRMQTVKKGGTTYVLDGAHNPQKMRAFVTSFQAQYPHAKVPVLLSLKQKKEYQQILPELFPIASEFVLTEYQLSTQPTPTTHDGETMAATIQQQGILVRIERDYKQALKIIHDQKPELVIVTGSLYLVGKVLTELTQPSVRS